MNKKIKLNLTNKQLAALIIGALLLFVGMIVNLVFSALENPEGQILESKNYGYEETELKDSIFVYSYSGSILLFGGSGRLINETSPIVAEVKYSSGAALMHRKIAISTGHVVTEKPNFYNIHLGSGAIIYDAMTDDGDAGLFKSVNKSGNINVVVDGKLITFGQGTWEYVEGSTDQIEIKFKEEDDEGKIIQRTVVVLAEELNADDSENIVINLSTGSDLTEVEVIEIKKPEPKTSFDPIPEPIKKEKTPDPQPTPDPEEKEEEEEEPEVIIPDPEPTPEPEEEEEEEEPEVIIPDPEPTPEPEEDDEDKDTLLWGKYPNTDEGNYDLATDKLNVGYCDRIEDSILLLTCREVINEALGKCDLLIDISKHEGCNNAHIKKIAVASDRISKCMEIQNDTALANSCISEINQNLYDAAIETGEPNVCKAIYNSNMVEECLAELGVEE